MRKLSVKRAKQNREYLKLRTSYLRIYPFCQFKGCYTFSAEIHHKKGRIGMLLTDVKFFMAVCGHHHNWIESHPEEAKEKGYSLSRLSKQ